MSKNNRLNKPPQLKIDANLFKKDYALSRWESLETLAGYKQDRGVLLTSSFFFGQNYGLESTSQLKVDFSEFSNHTFFNSAEVNVNVAFDNIINKYPFDGKRSDVIQFLEGLTGYEKWLFDNKWPRYTGFLSLHSESNGGEYIEIVDSAGTNVNIISSKKTGNSFIDPGTNSFSIETWLNPGSSSYHQTIFEKKNIEDLELGGIVLAMSGVGEDVVLTNYSGTLYFKVSARTSGSLDNSMTTISQSLMCDIPTSSWSHVVAEWDREGSDQLLKLYIDGDLKAESNTFNIPSVNFGNKAKIYIGSGSNWSDDNISGYYTGSIDDFRIWHGIRSTCEVETYKGKDIFAQDDLRLYLKFNEPNYTGKEELVLDHSSNALHGTIKSNDGFIIFPENIRINSTASLPFYGPMTYEDNYYSPVLFPNYSELQNVNDEQMTSASLYDKENPSLITRMIPEHYLKDASYFEFGDKDTDTFGTDIYETSRTEMNSSYGAHVLAGLLYTWAKHFDEIKIFIDQFSNLLSYGIDEFEQASNMFASEIGKFYGIDIKDFFNDASFRQFFEGENITLDDNWITQTLATVRDSLWERIFHSLPHILKSKGTIESLKSYIRAFGINPDNNFRFVEYGGTTSTSEIDNKRQFNTETAGILDMSGSTSMIVSPFLSSSNYDSANNGLLTSQSFTIEQTVKFIKGNDYGLTQSLMRLQNTGSGTGAKPALLFNLVALSSSTYPEISSSLRLYGKPFREASTTYLELDLSGVNIFDGDRWNICWGRNIDTYPSHSYFLMANKSNFGEIIKEYATSSFLYSGDAGSCRLSIKAGTSNASGSFIVIGSQSIPQDVSYDYLNYTGLGDDSVRYTKFDGEVSQIRFWSKALSTREFYEHSTNYKSLGVDNPLTSFNFSGSYYKELTDQDPATEEWGRLRLDISTDQDIVSSSVDGSILLKDYSQNKFYFDSDNVVADSANKEWKTGHMYGTGFEESKEVIKNEDYFYTYLSPYWDESTNSDKVHINKNGCTEIDITTERIIDDRFSVEFSIVHALNEDIVTIFSSLQKLGDYIGNTSDMFSGEYKDLENLRKMYFNRLRDKVNIKGFFDFFCWFDENIFEFAKQLIPARTRFIGNNFVIESHMLERPKFFHKFYTQYVDKENLSISEIKSGYNNTSGAGGSDGDDALDITIE